MKKILIITQKVDYKDSNLGFFHRWVEEFSKHCDRVTVVCLQKGEYKLPKNVEVLSLGKESGASRIKYVFNFYKYILRERKNYDSVFVHMNPIYIVLGGLLWRALGKRVSLWYTHKGVDMKLRLAVALTDTVFSASRESFGIKSRKLRIMGHGIDTDIFQPSEHPLAESVFRIITVGRITRVKNFLTIIEAVKIVHDKGIAVTLRIVGEPITEADKAYESLIRATIMEKKLDSNVTFLGALSQQDIKERLVASNAFINMSDTGSLDKAVLEAMACGLPAITSNEAFAPMLGPRGLMVQSGNAQMLADKLIDVHTNRERARDLGLALRNVVLKEHNLSTLISKLYQQI